jgi:integrase/recombinase XerC
VSACVAIEDVLTRAGLARERDVRPASVAAWAGRKILEESGQIDEVARRLGMRSLDRAARFVGFDWHSTD